MNFQEVYKRLNGCAATADDVLKFERLVSTLETTPNDALLSVLIALDHYERLYEEIPDKISECTKKTLVDFRRTSTYIATAAMHTTQAAQVKVITDMANEVAAQVATKNMWKWAAGCIATVSICLTLACYGAYEAGHNGGYGVGYEQAKDEKAAAAWANTPQGRDAYLLAQAGDIEKFIHCNQPGWVIENGNCFGAAYSQGKIFGWKLPKK